MNIAEESSGRFRIVTLVQAPGESSRDFAKLKQRIAGSAAEGAVLLVDARAVEFMDSLAIGTFVGIVRAFDEAGGCAVVCGLAPKLVQMLKVVNVDRVVPLRLSVRDAMAELDKIKAPKAAQLAAKNPTVEDFQKSQPPMATPLPIAQQPANASGDAIPRLGAAAPAAAGPPPPAWGDPQAFADWARLLALFGETKQIADRYGAAFHADTTFRALVSDLAQKIAEKKN